MLFQTQENSFQLVILKKKMVIFCSYQKGLYVRHLKIKESRYLLLHQSMYKETILIVKIHSLYLFDKQSKTVLVGRVAEWSNAPVLKTGVAFRLPRVRIPPLPIDYKNNNKDLVSFLVTLFFQTFIFTTIILRKK